MLNICSNICFDFAARKRWKGEKQKVKVLSMNSKRIGYIALIVIGIVCTFLNGWVFLLEREGRFLLFAFMGILVIIAGAVRLRR
jgi:hypothetical protein